MTVRQSAFTVLTSIRPGETENLTRLLDEIGADVTGNPHLRFGDFDDLHYASLFVIGARAGRPFLVFEGNVDGRPSAFFEKLVRSAGAGVDTLYRHCEGYPPAGARLAGPVRRYLRGHDIGADTFYVNRPGRTVQVIRQEQDLRVHIEAVLDDRLDELTRQHPEAIRQALVDSLPEHMGWARAAAPAPLVVRYGRRVIYLCLVPVVLPVLELLGLALAPSPSRRRALGRAGLVGVAGLVVGTVRRLRAEERADEDHDLRRTPSWQEVYAEWTQHEDRLGAREDHEAQNHMVSVTQVKDGWFRFAVLRLVLFVLNLVARLNANQGSLGSITSIHFARWVLTPDRQLVFMSNYDGGWERYLNDFVERASPALTAVWSNTTNDLGFPVARWLVRGGAKDEPRFKAYARFSMVPTNAWYCAYPELSAANIGTNMAVRDGLSASPDPMATEAWLRHL